MSARVSPALPNRDRTGSVSVGLLCAALAVLVAVPLTSSGYVLALHVVGILLLPVILSARVRVGLRALWAGAIVWTLAQLLSNLFNGGDFSAATGYMGITIMVTVGTMAWLRRTEGVSAAAVCMAFALGWIGLSLIGLGALEKDDLWKFALAFPVGSFVLAVTWARNSARPVVVGFLAVFVAMSLLSDARFFAALGVSATVLVLFRDRRRPSPRKVAVLGGVTLLCAYLLYPVIAVRGLLGDRAQFQQIGYDARGVNFLVENRAEFFQALYLSLQQPLLGVGAKQRVDQDIVGQALRWLDSIGANMTPARVAYLTDAANTRQGYAPHSAMFDGVIQGGAFVLFFWVVAIVLTAQAVLRYTGSDGGYALLLLMGGGGVWNAFFSPPSTSTLLGVALMLFLATEALHQAAHSESESEALSCDTHELTHSAERKALGGSKALG